MRYNLISKLCFLFVLMFSTYVVQAAPDAKTGKKLFNGNCASCHNGNMKDKSTGPALYGTQTRWKDFPKEDLYKWVRNSQGLIASGHPRATALFSEYKSQMTAFPNLTDEEIESLLLYIDQKGSGAWDAANKGAGATTNANNGVVTKKSNNNLYLWLLLAGLVALSTFLFRINDNLSRIARERSGLAPGSKRTLAGFLTSSPMISFFTFIGIVLLGYWTVNGAISLGRQQNYAPDQPIKFSHKTHAGINKIDCQYCHDGARRSKHSIIPATNTCINCHAAIKKGPTYGTGELVKIYASAGFNPSTGKYIENYQEKPVEEIKTILETYIREQNKDKAKGASLDRLVAEQLKAAEPMMKKPIEWVRIHNLPDHVYFNHSQHVTVGQVQCQTCHGAVEEMDVVKQYSPLSMGWCINCHRETKVKFTDNKYYEHFERFHSELKSGKRSDVKVEDIGGLECQKCHY